MQVVPRVRKMFGKGVGEFKLIVPTDKILIPVDADGQTQSLVALIFAKVKKMPVKPTVLCAHFYSGEKVDEETNNIILDLLKKCPMDIIYEKCSPVSDRKELLRTYVECAVKNGCNKVAIPDTVNFMNATLIATMCTDGVFNGPDPAQNVQLAADQPNVTIIRPFCYVQDQELDSFIKKNNLQSHPTGVNVPEEKATRVARESIQLLYTEAANIHTNIFNSQFQIQDKYLGAGDGKTREVFDFEE